MAWVIECVVAPCNSSWCCFRVIEAGTPHVLLQDAGSHFASMLGELPEIEQEALAEVAKQAQSTRFEQPVMV